MKSLLYGVFLFLLTIFNPVTAKPFSDIVVFGGPLEDTGNFASVFGELPPPFFKNRLSNGPLAVEIFAARLGLKLKPSLHRVGPVVGNNFSSSDAFAFGNDPKDLPGQVDAYLASRNEEADPDALYYIIIGGNEVVEAAFDPDDFTARQKVVDTVRAKGEVIKLLVAKGAKTILVSNLINFGITPALGAANLSDRGAKLSQIHNRLAEVMLSRLERRLDFELIRYDWDEFTNGAIKNADILGFSNISDSCLDLLFTGECNFSSFLFFNEFFPTANVHELIADDMLSILIRSRRHCEGESVNRRMCRHRRRIISRFYRK